MNLSSSLALGHSSLVTCHGFVTPLERSPAGIGAHALGAQPVGVVEEEPGVAPNVVVGGHVAAAAGRAEAPPFT